MPRKRINEILQLDFNVALAYPNGHEGSVSTYELLILNALVKKLQPKLVVEFGTLDGRTALNFALNAPTARVLTLDLAQPRKPLFAGTSVRKRIETVIGDSLNFDTRKYRGKAGFVFIDGGHDAPVVTSDSYKALELVAYGGVVVWHDYTNFPGAQKAVALAMRGTRGRFYQVKDTSMVVYFAPRDKGRHKRA